MNIKRRRRLYDLYYHLIVWMRAFMTTRNMTLREMAKTTVRIMYAADVDVPLYSLFYERTSELTDNLKTVWKYKKRVLST